MDPTEYEKYRISDDELNQFLHSTRLNDPPILGKFIQHLVAERMAYNECIGNYRQEVELYREQVEELKERAEENWRERHYGEHYGPYGVACAATGQFDAGFCWKCQIKKLEESKNGCII